MRPALASLALLTGCAIAPIPPQLPDCTPDPDPDVYAFEQTRGCFLEKLTEAPALAGKGPLAIEFSICANGDFADLWVTSAPGRATPAPEVSAAVDRAIQSCRWFPAERRRERISSRLSLLFEPAPPRLRPMNGVAPVVAPLPSPVPDCGARPPAIRAGSPFHTRPRLAVQGCVASALRVPPAFSGLVGRTQARFRVGSDGCVGEFSLYPEIDKRIVEAVERAVRSCAWIPGHDAEGRVVDMEALLPVRFTAQRL